MYKENIQHALFECTWAKLFWQEIKVVTGGEDTLFPSYNLGY
jgi:hypothetical protein